MDWSTGGADSAMNRLMEFTTEDGAVVVVEATDGASGTRLVSRGEGGPAAQAARTFEGALDGVRAAAHSALRVFRDGSLRPDSVELEFGVKLSAEAGAVIAKGAAEGQLVVRLGWTSQHPSPEPSAATVSALVPETAAASTVAPGTRAPAVRMPATADEPAVRDADAPPVSGAPPLPAPASATPEPSPRS